MYSDEDYLMLSGIQHFDYCRRQWGLIHVADEWQENVLTIGGDIMHERAHDDSLRERRGDTIIVRGLTVRSSAMGVIGQCDVVEFHQSEHGHPLVGEDGLWSEFPVEYKHGHAKTIDADRLQLTAQAMCLEEMFGSEIPYGFLYYGETRSREKVEFLREIRQEVERDFAEMHSLYQKRWIPKARYRKSCRSCSLYELCMPKAKSAQAYVDEMLEGSL
ncbi:CRISPR-associated protein Cas4 [Olsenella sp. Marseille-P4559]|uniref:CRISPR-associated protein Cas4 n=1 Tax=Olsenella sp. Marseille-P4559 TaxID=2364795 RepID=UPI0010307B3D|nr:CRISPR-associated protein Cas4 [Olsenella sp. Marseille-P4559]